MLVKYLASIRPFSGKRNLGLRWGGGGGGGELNFGKAIGPDMVPNRVLKDFAPELAPLIMDIYNCSLREGYVPDLLKRSIINPLPKVSPPQEIQSDLRPNASDMHPCQSHGRVCAQQARGASFGKT